MSGRFPGADDVDAFWRNISSGKECFTEFSDEELILAGVDPEIFGLPNYVRSRPVLGDIRGFDTGFFGISAREATRTDPQHRLFVECAWEALEGAGYARPDDRGAVGVFAGMNIGTYLLTRLDALRQDEIKELMIDNDKDALATNVSFRLDLRGPAVTVQNYCATSLVAVHLASESLRRGECDLAVAGGVSVIVPDRAGYLHVEGHHASPDGRVRVFDAGTNGDLYGDAVAVVALKRLDRALADRDTVLGVIRGSAVNNDGGRKPGRRSLSIDGQRRCVTRAIAVAGVDPAQISYVEAHGSATKVGDSIEVAALTSAFSSTGERQHCVLGSVKPNVGHLDRASGVTGLIKIIQSLRHELIPATLHYTTPNPEIDFANSPFRVTAEPTPWPRQAGRPRIAGLNSYGMGGTNAHAIVAEAPPPLPRPRRSRRWQVLPVSARSARATEQSCARLAERLSTAPGFDLGDVAYTLQVGRKVFGHRKVVVADTIAGAVGALVEPQLTRSDTTVDRRVGFLIAGDGEQYPGMVAALYADEPGFREDVDECLALLGLTGAANLPDMFVPAERGRPTPQHLIQPAVFVAEYALARQLMRWGVRPEIMVGYDLGEYVAACLSGVLSVADAVRLVAHRAELMASLPGGAMLAVATELTNWVAKNITLHPPGIPYVCNVTGELATEKVVTDPGYWARHLCETAGFGAALAHALRDGDLALVEIGPGRVLASAHPDCDPAQWPLIVNTVPAATDQRDAGAAIAEAVGRLWLAGVTIDWPALHGTAGWQPGRVPLPTYPFERQDCWLPAEPGRDDAAGMVRLPDTRWINVPVWRQTTARPARAGKGTWLIYTDAGLAGTLSESIRGHLEAAGCQVVLARPGDRFASGADGLVVRPGSTQDATTALRELIARGLPPDRVVHLWTADDGASDTADCLRRGFHTLVAFARAAGNAGLAPWSLDVVTAGSHRVLPGDTVRPERATLLGPCRLIPVEYPGVRARLIDLDRATAAAPQTLVAELRAEPADRVVALRGGRRWVPGYEVLDAACLAGGEPAVTIRRGGAYLVTGGLGGIGLAMAERLAADYRARLVLLGRTPVPPRDRWRKILAAPGTEDEVRRRLDGLQRLEALGADVITVAGDVSKMEDVRRAVGAAVERFGGLDGVLHCAGVPAAGLMQFKTATGIEKVLAPKVAGSLAIAEALRDMPVDFVALFSSTGGGAGQVDYCAANAFLDAFAQSDPLPGCMVTSIGWGKWTWNGWTTGPDSYDRKTFGISFDQGWQALQRVLACGEPHVVVSTQDFASQPAPDPTARTALGRRPRPELSTSYVEPESPAERAIAAVWTQALGLDRVGVHDDFFELGGTSLVGVGLIAEVRRALELDYLPPQVLHQAPTVAALAEATATAEETAEPATTAGTRQRSRIEQRRNMLRTGRSS